MAIRRKLIEVALPLQAINEASAREKSVRHGHPSALHPWWPRRPLTTSRAVVFASFVDDPNGRGAPRGFVEACRRLPRGRNAAQNDTPRQRLLDFVERLVQWESTTDEEGLGKARELIRLASGGEPPALRDPFAGGGSLLLEAQRLGLEAHASDINPVAVLICKALIEVPPRFIGRLPVNRRDRAHKLTEASRTGTAGLVADVRYYGKWVADRVWDGIGYLYPEHVPPAWGLPQRVTAWLWARTVECPNPECGAQMPLLSSYWLGKRKGRRAWVVPRVDRSARTVSFEIGRGDGRPMDPPKVGRGAHFRCLVCGAVAGDPYLTDEGLAGRMGVQLMAMATEGSQGRDYFAPSREQEEVAAMAGPAWRPAGRDPSNGPQFSLRVTGLVPNGDLFTPRQLITLTTMSDLIAEVRQQIRSDALASGLPANVMPLRVGGAGPLAYGAAVSVYLALGLCRLANHLSTLCSWDARSENVRQVFTRQSTAMAWHFAEANPFSNSPANYLGQLDHICGALELLNGSRPGTAVRRDATRSGYSQRAAFATDPPYYDSSDYAGPSDYAYGWLRRSLQGVYPEDLSTSLSPANAELVAIPRKPGGEPDEASRRFERGLYRALALVRGAADPDYPLTTFCALDEAEAGAPDERRTSTGWETMLESLIRTGFTVLGTWPIRTDRARGSKARGNVPAPAAILVCRPRPTGAPKASRHEFVSALRRELPGALHEMLSANIAPVDLAQCSIGPGLAVYSRYSEVLEPDGSPLTLRTALDIIDRALDVFLVEQEEYLDAASRFAVAWYNRFSYTVRTIEEAHELARMRRVSVEYLIAAAVLGSQGSRVWLRRWADLDRGWDPTVDERPLVWKATHHLIWRLNVGGEEVAARLLARMPAATAAEARQLAYRLYSISDRKGWVEEAKDYGGLIDSWGAIQIDESPPTELFTQRRLFD